MQLKISSSSNTDYNDNKDLQEIYKHSKKHSNNVHAAFLSFTFSLSVKNEWHPTYDLMHLMFVHIALAFMLTKPISLVDIAKKFGHVPNECMPCFHANKGVESLWHILSHSITQVRKKKRRTLTGGCYMHQQTSVTLLLLWIALGLGCSSTHNKSLRENRIGCRTLRFASKHKCQGKGVEVEGYNSLCKWKGETLCKWNFVQGVSLISFFHLSPLPSERIIPKHRCMQYMQECTIKFFKSFKTQMYRQTWERLVHASQVTLSILLFFFAHPHLIWLTKKE